MHYSVAVFTELGVLDLHSLLEPFCISHDNLNGKMDYYTVGGQWEDYLTLRSKRQASSAKVRNINFSPNVKKYDEAIEFWNLHVEEIEPTEELVEDKYLLDCYKLDCYKDKYSYAKHQSIFSTNAVITPDGTWHSVPSPTHFYSDEEYYKELYNWVENYPEKFISTASGDWTLTIIDCHI